MNSSFVIAGALVAWIPLAVLLARLGARGLLPDAAPLPVRGIALAALGLVPATLAQRPADSAVACGVATIALVVAGFVDARTGFLPDAVTAPAAVIIVVATWACGSLSQAAAGVVLVVGIFGTIVAASRGRLMGLGDVKAMYALAAAFGPAETLFAVGTASLSGIAAAALSGRLRKRAELRFGPHLALGSVVALVFGDRFVHGVLGL